MTKKQHNSNQETTPIGQQRTFFAMIPGMIEFMAISPAAYRLYSHYIRVTKDGESYDYPTGKTAEWLDTSRYTIIRARTELQDLKLIYTNRHLLAPEESKTSKTVSVKPRDVWPNNAQFHKHIREFGMPPLHTIKAWIAESLTRDDRNPFAGDDPTQPNPWANLMPSPVNLSLHHTESIFNVYLGERVAPQDIDITCIIVMHRIGWNEPESYAHKLDYNEQSLLLMWMAYTETMDGLQNRAGYIRSRFEDLEPLPTNMPQSSAVDLVKGWIEESKTEEVDEI